MKQLLLLLFLAPMLLLGQIKFTDQADRLGLGESGPNYGVAIADYDKDGWEDIYICRRPGPNRLYKNIGGNFVELGATAGVDVSIDTKAAIWGDFDNDGWVDLFLANRKGENDMLFKNNRNGTFTDISVSAGIQHKGDPFAVITGDVNNDSYLDIYIAHFDGQNVLWRNNGNMTFTDVTVSSGVTDNFIAMGATFIDFDNDNDLDIYLTHDGYGPNIMYLNDGKGNFYDVAPGINADIAAFGMGVDVGDINNDGWYDIYITNLYPNNLLLNNGMGSYTDITTSAGVGDPGMGWGTAFLDVDNDGWQDIYMANTPAYPNILYHNNKDSTFTNISEGTVLSSQRGNSYGVATMDYNKDGKIDIFMTNSYDTVGVQVFRNETVTSNHWFEVKATSTQGNATALGARVEIYAGDHHAVDMISGGSSWVAQHSPIIHFGLGSHTLIDSLKITWPGGNEEVYYQLPVDQLYSVTETGSPASLNVDEINGIRHILREDGLYLSLPPNPSSAYSIALFSISGQQASSWYKLNPSSQEQPFYLDTSSIVSGLYVLNIQEGDRQSFIKVLLP